MARERINSEKCYFCPRRADIEAHHIVPKRFNGSDQRENLVGVCERCHAKLERLYDKRFYEKLGIADETGERYVHFECTRYDCDERADEKVYVAGHVVWYCNDHAKREWDSRPHLRVVSE